MISREPSDPTQKPRGKESLIGQQCIVKKGGWKGFEGIVKDADDKSMRIELSAKAKVITIPRDCVQLKNEPTEVNYYDSTSRFDQSCIFFIIFLKFLLFFFFKKVGKTPIHPGRIGSAFNPTSPFHGQSPGYISSPWQ